MARADIDRIVALLAGRPIAKTTAERRTLSDQAIKLFPPPADTAVTEIKLADQPADAITATASDRRRKVLYLHGGGYVIGSRVSHRTVCSYLAAAAKAEVLLLDYRLAPEHPFPAAVDDAVAAYEALLASRISPEHIVIAGDSAGGGLALAAAMVLRDRGIALPAGLVVFSPWIDLAGESPSLAARAAVDPHLTAAALSEFGGHYLGKTDARHPLVSPIYADLKGMPPLFIQVGEREILYDDSLRLFQHAEAARVQVSLSAWPHMTHVWHRYAPELPEAREALIEAGGFIMRRVPLA